MDNNIISFKEFCLNEGACFKCSINYVVENMELKKKSICMECGTSGSLWFCIQCTYVGCGRFNNRHALAHYKISQHIWVMNIENFKIWDYERSAYLHHELDDAKFQRPTVSSGAKSENLNCQCTVCRYHQLPKCTKVPICMTCGGSKNLWICVQCSHVGCGRTNKHCHARDHYNRTNHSPVMHLNNFSIWDYKEKKYGHHLITESPAETKSEVNPESAQNLEDRMQRLEKVWKNYSKLKETNRKMISIEQRLLSLCEEKQLIEGKLKEHDAKLNELLNEFKGGNRDILSSPTVNLSQKDPITPRDVQNMRSSLLTSSQDSHEVQSPIPALSTSDSVDQSQAIIFVIFLLFLYQITNLFFLTITGEILKLKSNLN